ncbi:MAG: TerD family protein [Pseudomonadota bacterium]
MHIQPGQRAAMRDITPNTATWNVGVRIDGPNTDIALFGLDAQGKLSDERYMIFYNQPASPCGGIELRTPAGDQAGFVIRHFMLPPGIERLVLTAAVDGIGTMGNVSAGHVRILDAETETSRFAFSGKDFMLEKAVMLGEFYRKDGGWRFWATAQGFNGGLEALVRHFGGEVEAQAPRKPASAPSLAANPPPAADSSVSLHKVTLHKNQSVSMEKKGDHFGEIRVNLNWNQQGNLARMDLDLGCLFELAGGQPGAIQALGNHFGDYFYAPWIELMGDDRSGQAQEGETLRINGQHWVSIRRVLIFASIYDGAPNWAATDAQVSIRAPGQQEIVVELDEYSRHHRVCAVASIENVGGAVRVTKHVTFHTDEEMLDHAYRYGLRWTAGSK